MSVTIEELVKKAQELGASDLHLSAGMAPRCRVNGELQSLGGDESFEEELQDMLVSMMTERQVRKLKAYGEADFAGSLPGISRFRVNVFRQRGTLAAVLRLVGDTVPRPEDLSVPSAVVGLLKKKRGLILATGPAGSGKSSVLASFVGRVNQERNVHVITLEEPIEYLHQHNKAIVNQREIGFDTRTYAGAIKAALREDPEVIQIGDIGDSETIAAALIAAESGHLVLAAMNTSGTVDAISRMIEAFPPERQQMIRLQLSVVLEAVLYRQLIPSSDGGERIAVHEVLYGTREVKAWIREDRIKQIAALMQTGKKQGMQPMDDAIYEQYLARRIDREQALYYASDEAAMARRLHS